MNCDRLMYQNIRNSRSKYVEIDRVQSFNYAVNQYPDTVNKLDKLSEHFDIKRWVVMRENVCEYCND